MIFITIIGVVLYFILPQLFVIWLLDLNNYKIFKCDVDPVSIGLFLAILQVAMMVQFLVWMY